MSLPTSFFHTRVPLVGGGWLLQFDTTNKSMYMDATKDTLRYVDALQAGYVGFDDLTTNGNIRSAHIMKFDKDGNITYQNGYNRGSGLELRSFDVFDDGTMMVMGEDGGQTYFATVDSNGSTNGTGHRFYNSVYGWSMARREGATPGSSFTRQVAWAGRLATDQRMVIRNYGWDTSTNFSGLGNQRSSYNGGNVVQPNKVIVREDNQVSAIVGRYPQNGDSSFANLYTGLFSFQGGHFADLGDANLYNQFDGACWDYGQRGISSNTNNSLFACGYLNNSDGQQFGSFANYGNYGFTGGASITTTTGWSTDLMRLLSCAYDDVGTSRRVYVVGKNRSPLAIRNAAGGGINSYDGVLLCINVSNVASPTLEWAQGWYMTQQNGTVRAVDAWDVVVDDDGQLIVSGSTYGYTNGRVRQLYLVSLPTSGPISQTVNGLTFYDATSLYQMQSVNWSVGQTDDRSSSWSESNQTMSQTNGSVGTGVLTEL